MRFYKFLIPALICGTLAICANAATLTFIAQSVGGNLDDNWFNAANWFVPDNTGTLVPAGRVPLTDEGAIVIGTVDLQASGVRVKTLLATNNAVITNGTLAVENLQLLSGSGINGATVNVLTSLTVGGTNCTLRSATLNLFGIGSGSVTPIPPATASSLVLTQGSALNLGGLLLLSEGSQIRGGGLSKLTIESSGVLISGNATSIVGSDTNMLAIDNSGLVRCDSGTLVFDGAIRWESSGNAGEFRAASPGATIQFNTPFNADPGVISAFTGPGTNRWVSGATIDGVAQVSALDPSTQLAGSGWLEVNGTVSGAGTLHVLGTTNAGGTGSWTSGTISLSGIGVDPGAIFAIAGSNGTEHLLQNCIVTNFGQCALAGGNLNVAQNSQINNENGAIFLVQADGLFFSFPGGGAIDNFGTFQKTSTGTTSFILTNSITGLGFNNAGLVDIRAGELNLLGGNSSGEFRQSPGTLLWFWGGAHQMNPGASFTGSSSVRVMQGAAPAECFLNDAFKFSQLEIGLNGIVDATAAPSAAPIQISSLLTHENALITNGTYQILNFDMKDGTVLAGSTMTIGTSLTVEATNCVFSASTLNIQSGASGLLKSANGSAGGVLTLSQGAVFQDAGQFALIDGTSITGGTAPSSKLLIEPGAELGCTNSGTIGSSANAPLVIDNNGTVQVNSGSLVLANGLTWTSSFGSGHFNAAGPNDAIIFTGPFSVPQSVTDIFMGLGTNYWLNQVTVDGTAQVAGALPGGEGNLMIAAAVSGTGGLHAFGNPAQAGTILWKSGTVNVVGITIDPAASLHIGGDPNGPRHLSGATLNNAGYCVFTGGDLSLASVVFNNLSGGSVLLQTNVSLLLGASAGVCSFNNAGLVDMTASGNALIGPSFLNTGTLHAHSGSLAFQTGWTQTQGSTVIDSGAMIASTNLTLEGGTISGTGTIAANLLNNGGTVSPGSPFGILSVGVAQNYQQAASASLAIELGGTTGVLMDELSVGGVVQLGGQLSLTLTNGFTPQPGQTFQILSASSIAGRFSQINSPAVPGSTWVVRYNPGSVNLVLANQITLPRPSISGGALKFSINTTAGVQYLIEATDNLNPVNWQTLTTLNGDGTVQTASEPITGLAYRFYRVVLQ